jgi:hypothetical protein
VTPSTPERPAVAAPGSTPAPADPVAAFLPGGLPQTVSFPPTSRYSGVPLAVTEVNGREVRHLTRRFVPGPERFAAIDEHVVTEGERPDTMAAARLGDPELFWRLCDANNVLHPSELVDEIGRRIRVTLPEGIPGIPDE